MSINASTSRLKELDKKHHLHPFTGFGHHKQHGGAIYTKAYDSYVQTSDGETFLDAMSGLWCVNLGYSQQKIKDAIANQLNTLPYYNSLFQCTNDQAIELASMICERAPKNLNHCFFTSSGSEAVDTAIRFSRLYWKLRGHKKKMTILSRNLAYHGSTLACASLGGFVDMHKQQGLALEGFEHLSSPYYFYADQGLTEAEFVQQLANELEKKILDVGEENIAAFFAEPIQGAGGVIIPPKGYWAAIREVLQKYNILFVADEVICGFGRLGKWFGSEYYGNEPDVIIFAKGVSNGYVPLGGVLLDDEIVDVLGAEQEIVHGFTYSGHPVTCAAGIATLNVMNEDNILQQVQDTIPYFHKSWMKLAEHPLVGECRVEGMLGAFQLVKSKPNVEFPKQLQASIECRENSLKQGLIMRAVGEAMVVAPTFVMSKTQIDEMCLKATSALDATADKFGDHCE